MKPYILITFSAFFILLLSACEKDNVKEPGSVLSGRIVYQGQPVGLRSSGVQFELWQPGYQLYSKIPLNIAQDGTFSALLFDGDYKLVRTPGAGPWADNTDTINVLLKGTADVDVLVQPYFLIKNAAFEKNGSAVKATFTIEKNTSTKTLELARLYIGPNVIVDQNNNSATAQASAAAITIGQPVTVNVNIPSGIANETFIYARIGVKTTGVAELLYTEPQRIQLK
jgi:hypothetical protein